MPPPQGGVKGRLRAKSILLPRTSIVSLTLRLHLLSRLLPALVRWDGDLDLDLTAAGDPLRVLAESLRLPQIADLRALRFAWYDEDKLKNAAPYAASAVAQKAQEIQAACHEALGEVQAIVDSNGAVRLTPRRCSRSATGRQ